MSQQINLYQPPFRREKQSFTAGTMWRAAAAVAAGVAVLYGIALWQVSSGRGELRRIDTQYTALADRVEDLNRKVREREANQNLDRQIERAERDLAALHSVQQALADRVLANTRGYSDHLAALARQHVAGMWLTGFDIAGDGERMRLQGRTTDPALVLRYVQRLSTEESLAGAEFEVFQMSRPESEKGSGRPAPYVEFLIRTAAKSERSGG